MPVVRSILLPALLLALVACSGDPSMAAVPECPTQPPASAPAQPWNDDPELADRIPDEIGGEPVEIQTVCATVRGGNALPLSPQMLEAVGVELEDVTLAVSPGPDATQRTTFLAVNAWRYLGGEEETIREAFLDVLEEAGLGPQESTIAGRTVHIVNFHAYYVAGDTLYAVLGEDDDVAAVLEALP